MEETGIFPTDGGGSQGEPSAALPQPRGRLGRVQSSRFRGIVLRLDWSHLLVAVVVALLVSEAMDGKARGKHALLSLDYVTRTPGGPLPSFPGIKFNIAADAI